MRAFCEVAWPFECLALINGSLHRCMGVTAAVCLTAAAAHADSKFRQGPCLGIRPSFFSNGSWASGVGF
jgi:hypothetical protein